MATASKGKSAGILTDGVGQTLQSSLTLKGFIQEDPTPPLPAHTASYRRRESLTAVVGFHPATQQFLRVGARTVTLLRKQMG